MAPPPWAQQEQQDFLSENMHEFLNKQTEKKLRLFWPDLFRQWFERWPIEVDFPTPAEEDKLKEYQEARAMLITKVQKRLKDWYNNHGNGKSKSRGSRPIKAFQVRKLRSPHAIEIYSRRYYAERVRDNVRAEILNQGLGRNEVLGVIRRLTAEAFEAEPEELKASICAEAEAAKGMVGNSHDPEKNTPETYAAAIEALPKALKQYFDEVSERTGWVFTILAGGPAPLNGGKIRTFGYDCGKNEFGLTFSAAHPSFQSSFLKPFAAFVKQSFPPGVCAARAVQKHKYDENGSLITTSEIFALAETTSDSAPSDDGSLPNALRTLTYTIPLDDSRATPTSSYQDNTVLPPPAPSAPSTNVTIAPEGTADAAAGGLHLLSLPAPSVSTFEATFKVVTIPEGNTSVIPGEISLPPLSVPSSVFMAPEANNLPPPCPSPPLVLPFNDGFDEADILDPLMQCAQGPGDGGSSVHSRLLPRFALAEDLSEPTDLLEPRVPLPRQQTVTPRPGSPQQLLTNQTPVLSTPAIAGPCPLTTPHERLPSPPMTLVNAPPEDGLTSITGEKRHSISPPPSPIAKRVKNVPPPVKLPAKRTLRSITSMTAPEPAGRSQRKRRVPASKEVITLAEKQARAVKETGAPMRKRARK